MRTITHRSRVLIAAMAIAFPGVHRALAAANLVLNGDFSSGNSGFVSGYTFISSGRSTTPGTYGIRTSSQDFNAAYASFGDHTNASGNMMLVDGAGSSSLPVWSEEIPVLPNSVYDFSAWGTAADSLQIAAL